MQELVENASANREAEIASAMHFLNSALGAGASYLAHTLQCRNPASRTELVNQPVAAVHRRASIAIGSRQKGLL